MFQFGPPWGNKSPLHSKASQPFLVFFSEFRPLRHQGKGVMRSQPYGGPYLTGRAQPLGAAIVDCLVAFSAFLCAFHTWRHPQH